MKLTIEQTPDGSRIIGKDIHTTTQLETPITENHLQTLIKRAFQSPDDDRRAESGCVVADRTADGVRVRVLANNSWFDIPWPNLARGIQ